MRSARYSGPILRHVLALLLFGVAPVPAQLHDRPVPQAVAILETTRDNTLIEEASGALSNGIGSRLFCGNTSIGEKRRGLVFFPVGDRIPACSKILEVELVMYMVKAISGAQDVTLHRVQASWGEAGSLALGGQGGGALALPGDATWLHRTTPAPTWSTPGGDFDAAASGSTVVDGVGRYTWASTPTMVADVQQWLEDARSNHGWLLRTDETNVTTAKAFATREDPLELLRPYLRVRYRLPYAAVAALGQGCAMGGGEPIRLMAEGLPVVPQPRFCLRLQGCGPTASASLFLFSAAPATVPEPLPGGGPCRLWIDRQQYLGTLVGDEHHTLHLPIPDQPALLGRELTVQAAAVAVPGEIPTFGNGVLLKFGL